MSIAGRLAWQSRFAPTRSGVVVVRRWRIALCVASIACFSAADAVADYPHVSKFIPANPNAYTVANRPFGEDFIDSISVHDTEGTYAASVFAFTYPGARAATNYMVTGEKNSSDPAVTQFVADKNWPRRLITSGSTSTRSESRTSASRSLRLAISHLCSTALGGSRRVGRVEIQDPLRPCSRPRA